MELYKNIQQKTKDTLLIRSENITQVLRESKKIT